MSFGRMRHPGFCLAWHSLPVPSSGLGGGGGLVVVMHNPVQLAKNF